MSYDKYVDMEVHVANCCGLHGCKFDKVCPVVDGFADQQNFCGSCSQPYVIRSQIKDLQRELNWSLSLKKRLKKG